MATLGTSWTYITQAKLGSSGGDAYVRCYGKYASQDVANNKTKGVQLQVRFYFTGSYIDCGVYEFTGFGNYYNKSTYQVNSRGDIVDVSRSSSAQRFGNGETVIGTSAAIDVAHGTNGTKSITMGAWCSFTSWGWENQSSVSVNLPTIDRSAPTITQSQSVKSATAINISGTSNVDCSQWAYQVDSNPWVYWTGSARSASNTATVTEGAHTIQIAGKKKTNNVWGFGTKVTVDTTMVTVDYVVDSVSTDSITITATASTALLHWKFHCGDFVAEEDSSNPSTTYTYTFGNLNVNTAYLIYVECQNPVNDLWGRSFSRSIKTQGGIVHVNVNGSWKEAIAYVKINNAWRQAICYTKVGTAWRINT